MIYINVWLGEYKEGKVNKAIEVTVNHTDGANEVEDTEIHISYFDDEIEANSFATQLRNTLILGGATVVLNTL